MQRPVPPAPARPAWRGRAAAVAVLLVMLLLAASAAMVISAQTAEDAQARFEDETGRIESALGVRMDAYRQVLRGARGLFLVQSGEVSREEWHTYIASQRLNETYPGIQGVGYAVVVPPGGLAAHEAEVRAEGFPDYHVYPPGPRAVTTSIIYLEPFADRNLRAFGYDMFSEPVRRAAMEQARDTGRAALSGKVQLVQENETDVQTGFLVYLPVYRGGETPDTVEARRDLVQGWVYSPFRTGDFTRGVLGTRTPEVAFDLFDGTTTEASAQLLARGAIADDAADRPEFSRVGNMTLVNHVWTLRYVSTPRFEAAVDNPVPVLILAGGGLISLLVFGITLSMAHTRERALALAGEMSEQRRATETRFRTIVETAHEGVWTFDVHGRTTYANGRMAAMLGLTPGEMLGRPAGEFFDPQDRARVAAALAAGRPGRAEQLELAMPHRAGEERWVLFSATPLPGEAGGGAVAVVADITARRRAEATERNAYQQRLEIERLRELDEAKTRLLNAASHELNTPLTPMQLHGEFLRSGALGELNPRQRRAIDVLVRNTERLAVLVEDVLDVARIQGGTVRMRREPVDLGALVEEAAESHMESAHAAGVTLHVATAPGLVVEGDNHRLTQVLFNLLHNAIKFTPPGGEVWVEAGVEGDAAVLRVRDTGIGITPAGHGKLFQPFSQVHDGESWDVGGTGLGLYISKGLVEHHGGRISAESGGPGQGSTFTVRLPLAAPVASPGGP